VSGDVDVDGDGDVLGKQRSGAHADNLAMLSFQRLDVYRCAMEFLEFAFELSSATTRGNAPGPASK
jgi:hypothetical protein